MILLVSPTKHSGLIAVALIMIIMWPDLLRTFYARIYARRLVVRVSAKRRAVLCLKSFRRTLYMAFKGF